MDEKLDFKDFDIIGLITLKDIAEIEKYVTPVKENGQVITYLSRSKEYYNVKSMTELALQREELKTRLTRGLTKRNFVILENMLNCSGKVYFKKFEQYVINGKNESDRIQLNRAEECLMEDVKNLLVILQQKGLIEVDPGKILPAGEENSEKRAIEMDNKALLYLFAKTLSMKKDPQNIEVVTPGYGSTYIGPFFKAMYGYNFTNILKSKYIEESKKIEDTDITASMSSQRAFEDGKTILLLDDNIGTGSTMNELRKQLEQSGINSIVCGAVQFNWRNYLRVSTGEKIGINRFEVNDFDIVTPINYAGHKLYKHAIDLLHSSGTEYIEYLKSKSYRLDKYCDIEGALYRAIISAHKTNLKLTDEVMLQEFQTDETNDLLDEYKSSPSEITNPISKRMIDGFIKNILGIRNPNLDKNTEEIIKS